MNNFLTIPFVIIFTFLIACTNNDESVPVFPEGSTESVNVWVQDSMKRYYYWADQMPAKPDYRLPVKDFFKSLLSPQDRFSFIVNTADASSYPRSIRNMYGFDYTVIQQSNGNVITVVKLVLKKLPCIQRRAGKGDDYYQNQWNICHSSQCRSNGLIYERTHHPGSYRRKLEKWQCC
ncbi:hypothetical protein [Chryseobacterium sp. P1-3]|uniref:hypothetical protein n=1 Tax=Chryseobacterium sp. (strain P1-3) TaxID=1517683 RepID=UPI001EE664C7|nr:hypothetical protein [Chryseobacterium sp. P1-3]